MGQEAAFGADKAPPAAAPAAAPPAGGPKPPAAAGKILLFGIIKSNKN